MSVTLVTEPGPGVVYLSTDGRWLKWSVDLRTWWPQVECHFAFSRSAPGRYSDINPPDPETGLARGKNQNLMRCYFHYFIYYL